MKNLKITVKTIFALEESLKEEIEELGYKNIKVLNRAVQLEGNWEDVYRLNYRCRLAIAVLVQIAEFNIHSEDDLYKQAMKIDWPDYFDLDKTFAVKGAVFSTLFRHSQYPMLVIKDAIADSFRKRFGERPNVNVKSPQVMFDVYIQNKTVIISLNTNGLPLFQRGYRQETGEAPINEVLAAGLLRLSGWDRKSTLVDPMTGSGTIAIEAALWAADIPAMIERRHYAFKNFKSYDEAAWEKVQKEGNNRPIDLGFEILAYDIDGEMIQKARRNSRIAPIGNMIKFERADIRELKATNDKGTLICNPPYDERMLENVDELYEKMGDTFKQNFTGYDCWVISSNMEGLKNIGLHANKRIKVFNGNLECSFRQFQIFEGSKKEQYENFDKKSSSDEKSRFEETSHSPEKGDFVEEKTEKVEKTKAVSSKYARKEPKSQEKPSKRFTDEGPKEEKSEVQQKYGFERPKYERKERSDRRDSSERSADQRAKSENFKKSDGPKKPKSSGSFKDKIDRIKRGR